ncbi:MAG: DUF421 domain-containing protein [Haemophilus parainfluenzae]|nr:DUF421 domain-containing protein [Haemophilus parainfluenzae]
MDGYTLLGLKLAMGIIGLVLQINLMGKGNLAPTSAMDQVQNYVLGGIIGGVIYSDSIGVFQFSLVLVLWTLLVFTLRFIKNHNKLVKSLIDGKPVWVISNGKVKTAECMKHSITANDLMFKLRAAGIYEIKTVKRAIFEQNGQLSIIQYGDDNLRYPLIVDGQLDDDVLDLDGESVFEWRQGVKHDCAGVMELEKQGENNYKNKNKEKKLDKKSQALDNGSVI